MKEIGSTIINKGMEHSQGLIKEYILENGRATNSMGKENSNGLMEKSMKAVIIWI